MSASFLCPVGFLSSHGFSLALLVPVFGVLLCWGVLGGAWFCGLVNILAMGLAVGWGLMWFSCGFLGGGSSSGFI